MGGGLGGAWEGGGSRRVRWGGVSRRGELGWGGVQVGQFGVCGGGGGGTGSPDLPLPSL